MDYSHIVPHLRLSDRHLIVPNYPGDARWWQQEEQRAKGGEYNRPFHEDREMTGPQRRVYEVLAERGEVSTVEICEAIGIRESALKSVMMGLTQKVPVYETMRGVMLVYGLLGIGESDMVGEV